MKRIILLSLIISFFGALAQNNPNIVKLENGKLKYRKDNKGNQVPDFSAVGYKNGEVAIPDVKVEKTLTARSGDNLDRIQAAIDEIGKML